MLHSYVSPDVLNRGGDIWHPELSLHQTSTVSSLASCLVTESSIRCLMGYKKPHRAQVRLPKFRLPFSTDCLKTPPPPPPQTGEQFYSFSSCLSRRAGLSHGLFVTSTCPVQISQQSWDISDSTTVWCLYTWITPQMSAGFIPVLPGPEKYLVPLLLCFSS